MCGPTPGSLTLQADILPLDQLSATSTSVWQHINHLCRSISERHWHTARTSNNYVTNNTNKSWKRCAPPPPCISAPPRLPCVRHNNSNNNNCIDRRSSRCFAISSLHRILSSTLRRRWPGHNRLQIKWSTLSAYHVLLPCATWFKGTAQLLSLTEFKWHEF